MAHCVDELRTLQAKLEQLRRLQDSIHPLYTAWQNAIAAVQAAQTAADTAHQRYEEAQAGLQPLISEVQTAWEAYRDCLLDHTDEPNDA